jgi:hypothetical protein
MNPAPTTIQIMVQLTDGTLLAQSYDGQTWMKLTPDFTGSYVNGTWTLLASGPVKRLYFASQVLPDGRFWLAGGEYTGPALQANWGNTGEIYDPVANTWTSITPFPPNTNCPTLTAVSGDLTTGSFVINNVYPQTTGIVAGWTMTGTGIPTGTTVLSTTANTITMSAAATATRTASLVNFNHSYRLASCIGDEPSVLVPGGNILVGSLTDNTTWLYNVATDSWTATGSKVYTNDSSDEEGWAKLPNGNVVNYDLFKSIDPAQDRSDLENGSYAEIYNPVTGMWSGISPSDGTAFGTIPQLSSPQLGDELGPIIRLQDGRILVIGATQHTALYDPSTNTWAAGPDIAGTLTNSQGTVTAPFGSDDAPAAIVPNGHVIFAADAGPAQVSTTGSITTASPLITDIPSTAGLQVGWSVSGTGVPSNTTIKSVDSASQVTMTANATSTHIAETIRFGGTFSKPTQLFDFDPTTNSISGLTPAIPDTNLPNMGAYPTRMLMLPTGQMMFSDSSRQPWVYTPDGTANPALRPAINGLTYKGGGNFTLTGKQLNGQSAGAAYGDDDQMDTNYPLVRFTATDGSGHVYYGKTTNWSSLAVGGGLTATQTVNVTLNPGLTAPGTYAMTVVGAGIASFPVFVNITQAEIDKQ